MGDVIVLGDTFFNGSYPLIDVATGGSIAGLIDAAGMSLRDVNPGTRVVPGHGPVGNRAALTAYRDMLVTVRDKVQAMKRQGRAESEVVAQAPTSEFDATWGHGFVSPASFVSTVYTTL
jgi:glyoxylase-like metal-dependent hydrolase (beta-lactamase superfamily II)